ncbi:MAG: insulinase family protein [Sedimentisphaerales bacterium]|nr:insulinase family protein [Sedimentisphaerales bacterium]
MVQEVRKIYENEITSEELALAKERFLNSFVFNFESKGQVVRRLMSLEYYGYPADFLEKTKANVEKVGKANVLRVARKHLLPDKLRILTVVKPDDFNGPPLVLGLVNEIDITIPSPQQ